MNLPTDNSLSSLLSDQLGQCEVRPVLTIISVAEAAGVSTATVSRVVNGNPGVTPETRNKVLETVQRLGYEPNLHAQKLSHSRRSLSKKSQSLQRWKSEQS